MFPLCDFVCLKMGMLYTKTNTTFFFLSNEKTEKRGNDDSFSEVSYKNLFSLICKPFLLPEVLDL